jgi:MSHA biogenesis protein MshL
MDRNGESSTTVSSGQLVSGPSSGSTTAGTTGTTGTTGSASTSSNRLSSSIQTKTKSNFWTQLTETLKTLVTAEGGRKTVVNSQAGLVIVRAYPAELSKVAEFLKVLQTTMEREVILEAKIIEVKLNDGFQSGVDWTALGLSQSINTGVDISDDLKTFTNVFTLDASHGGNFKLVVKLLETQGNVQVLSSPRISTLNNQKAVIKVGSDELFITNVSSTSAVSSGTATEVSQDIDLTPFFSGIALDVIPQIDENDEVTLHIHPSITSVTDQNKDFTINGKAQSLPLVTSSIRETDSVVHAKDGEVIVLGGLMENKTIEHIGSTPVLGDLPFVGPVFRRTSQESVKTELVILLRPIVVKTHTWGRRLNQTAHNFEHITRGFHYGSHPEVFGNLAEHKYGGSTGKHVRMTHARKHVNTHSHHHSNKGYK